MRVLLLSTPSPLEENPLPPLSLAYLAAALLRAGVEVRVLDFLVQRYHPRKLRHHLAEYRPHMVGINCVTMNYPVARRILRACKAFDPAIFTVIGGPHAGFALEDTLLRSPWIDAVAIGEGDDTVVELAEAVAGGGRLESVPGIAFARNGTVCRTASRPLIAELDRLPMPARHLLPLERYRALGVPCTLITARGCPYGCIFCSGHKMFGRRVRYRDPGLVVDEIEILHRDYGFPQVNIVDDTFTVNHHHAAAVCEEILRRGLKLRWSTFARVDNTTPELASLMKAAGCTTVLFGIESADEAILRTVRKGFSRAEIENGVRAATGAGLSVMASYILGLPGETPATFRDTLEFARRLNNRYGVQYAFHILAPLPGSELYQNAARHGLRLLTRNWSRYDANQPVTESATMGRDDMQAALAVCEQEAVIAWEKLASLAAQGDDEAVDRLRRIGEQEVVWKLLKTDALERTGATRGTTGNLLAQLERRTGLGQERLRPVIERLQSEGLLAYRAGRWCWQLPGEGKESRAPGRG